MFNKLKLKIKDLIHRQKVFVERGRKCYSESDIHEINVWFLKLFPKLIDEYIDKTTTYPV